MEFKTFVSELKEHGKSEQEIEVMVDKFAQQLKIEKEWLKNGEYDKITECGVYAPRLYTVIDKKYNMGHKIAYRMAGISDPNKATEKEKLTAYIGYSKLIGNIGTLIKERNKPKPKKIREMIGERLCLLKNKPAHLLSKEVAEPVPMEVTVAPYDELKDFFEFLEQGKYVERGLQSFKRGTMYDDGRIDLCKQVVGPDHIGSLMDSIQNNEYVYHFLLGNNIIGYEGAKAIAEYIEKKNHSDKKSKIVTWYLAGNFIDEEGTKLIAKALETDIVTKDLWLKRNPIKGGVKYLAEMLTKNSSIKTLDLTNTAVMDSGCNELFSRLIHNRTLRYLYLDGNGLTKECIPVMVEYYKQLIQEDRKGINNLWLGMNSLGDEGIIPLVDVLSQYRYFKRLNITSVRITEKSAEHIYRSFANHPKLMILDVGMYKSTLDLGEVPNSIKDAGVEWIAKLIEGSKSLISVNVAFNDLTQTGVDRLYEALKKNSNMIMCIYAEFYKKFDSDQVKDFHELLTKNIEQHCVERGILVPKNSLGVKQFIQRIKHGKRIQNIDSIYRNRM